MSVHKPRKKTRIDTDEPATPTRSGAVAQVDSTIAKPTFPLAAFYWPARKGVSQWTVLPLTLVVAGLFRWATSLWGYSGFQNPPMHGDFEAQRHWMEITTKLPVAQWYFYDLEYWGLDYPPLTAYHSWIIGTIGSYLNPSWFALNASRGIETQDLKIFMRASTILSEYLIYVPALVILNRRLAKQSGLNIWQTSVALMAILLQPSTILIDHGHFQYNSVMLGFTLAAMANMFADRLLWSCVFFVAALGFKQMALYYAPVVFAYLLGVCIQPTLNIPRLGAISITTALSFAVVFAPLLLGASYNHYNDKALVSTLSKPQLLDFVLDKSPIKMDQSHFLYPTVLHLAQAVHRIFPLARGLFEDKVANVWCAVHTVYKLNRFSTAFLSRLSLLATLIAITPSVLILLLAPKKRLIPYAFASCAWGFFLCSFQVHEKSVLLPLLPMTLLLAGRLGLHPEVRAWVGWANTLATWTMYPLLKRDRLRVPYIVWTLLWAYLMDLPPASITTYSNKSRMSAATKALHLSYYAVMIAWHVVEAFVEPPNGKPDLWVVINCVIGAAGFGICYLWCTWQLLVKSDLLKSWGIAQSVAVPDARTPVKKVEFKMK